MKLISWNVNGLRACMQKGFMEYFNQADADIFCLQETKLQGGQIEMELPGYHQYWNYAEKKGYSGTALFTKEEPLKVTCGIGVEVHDHEGRVITAEYKDYYVIVVYVPNSQRELTRLSYSDTDTAYNFIVALAFSQMFNLLCERADNVHGGRLPHHVRVL